MEKSFYLKKILIINNNPFIKDKMKEILDNRFKNKFDISVKRTIQPAIDHIARDGIPDLIITDFNQENETDLTAIDLTRFIRNDLHSGIPIIYYGGKFTDDVVANILIESLQSFTEMKNVLSPVFLDKKTDSMFKVLEWVFNFDYLLNSSKIDFTKAT